LTDTKIKVDKLIRSRRRSIALIVTRDAKVVVRAPLHTSVNSIESFINSKEAWVRRKLSEVEGCPAYQEKKFNNGEPFLFLGKTHNLCIDDNNDGEIRIDEEIKIPKKFESSVREKLTKWYRREAENVIKKRCMLYAVLSGLEPRSIKITSARQRWGSCGSKGTLNFNWRLVMAPIEVIDYVVVHELVHLRQKDHSRFFWAQVGNILPDYKFRKKWLKDNGNLLWM